MSAGDITRLNRMYNCQNYEASITLNDTTTKNRTQFSNGATIKRVGLNITKDNTDDLAMLERKNEMELNPNDTLTSDDDDMILSKEQIDALYSLNAAKRNGLKSVFHHWPMGLVAFEIDPTFRKTFTAFSVLLSLVLGTRIVKRWKMEQRGKMNMKVTHSISTDPDFILTITESMNYISNRSCIRFAPRTPNNQNNNFIYITKGAGCSSEVGMRNTGKQLMNINEEFCPRGKIIHELLHSLGFLHMQ